MAIAISTLLILTGCASEPEFGEVSSAIQDSQEMQAEDSATSDPEPSKTSSLDPEVLARAQAAEKARLEAEGNLDLKYARDNNLWKVSTLGGHQAEVARLSLLDSRVTTPKVTSVISSDSVPIEDVALYESAIQESRSLWTDLVGPNEGFKLVVFTANDAEWADNLAKDMGLSASQTSFQKRIAQEGCNGGGINPTASVDFLCAGDYFEGNESAIKRYVAGHYFMDVLRLMDITHLDWPLWLKEGSGNYMGLALTETSGSDMLRKIGETRVDLLATMFGKPEIGAICADIADSDTYEIYKKLDVPLTLETRALLRDYDGYDWGALAFGRIVEEIGFDGLKAFMSESSKLSLNELFQKYLGESKDDFYKSMSTYLQSRFVWDI